MIKDFGVLEFAALKNYQPIEHYPIKSFYQCWWNVCKFGDAFLWFLSNSVDMLGLKSVFSESSTISKIIFNFLVRFLLILLSDQGGHMKLWEI